MSPYLLPWLYWHLVGGPVEPVAEAIRQQRAVMGGHVRWDDATLARAQAQDREWQAAAACAERELFGAASEWLIRASSQHGTCHIVNEQEAP